MTITLNGTTGITNDGGYTGDGVVFADTTPANTLVTTTGGNVGIRTSSPAVRLDVAGSNQTTIARTYAGSTSFTQYVDDSAGGVFLAANTVSGTNAKFLAFQTVPSGGAATERMRIDSSGNLLVGKTSSGSGIAGLQIYNQSGTNGRIDFSNTSGTGQYACGFYYGAGATFVGNILTNATSTSYATSSDYRLKENIAPMTGALAKVAALKPVTYKWKVDGSDGEGFIAHELQEVVHQCVAGEKDAVDEEGNPKYQGIDTSFLVATLTAAIQEQQQLITALTARVAALEGTQNV